MRKQYLVKTDGRELYTQGLCEYGFSEVMLRLNDGDESKSGEKVLRVIGDYMVQTSVSIRPGEKIAYGSWTLLLEGGDDNTLQVTEYNHDTDGYIGGASFAMSLWDAQEEMTASNGAQCMRPSALQLVVISDGVIDGEPVQGVRYHSPDHMSGWWLTSAKYSGDHRTLRKEHCIHLIASRKDLGAYLALPNGYRFDSGSGRVWYDEEAANQA